jgi:D-beta-D-heptose 7-phosphate kinase/D-beta-D-heptose 1-phosphate adenosyltransferase
MLTVPGRPTTVKRSFIGLAQHRHPQKMFRVDHECADPVDEATAERLVSAVQSMLGDADVLCIEDYNKGLLSETVCQQLIKAARQAGVPVLVDPALVRDFRKYHGATAITPNRFEAEQATGLASETDAQLRVIARRLLDELDLQAVVLTLDRRGAMLAERGAEPVQIPTLARNVYDVTGAGDMVLAALAGALANGADFAGAVKLANLAAGLEVEKFGIVPVPLTELHLSVLLHEHEQHGKLRQLDQLLPELRAYRAQGRRIAFTNGCFDILHAGHVELLRQAKQTADLLVLAINSDVSIRQLKGPDRPIVSEHDRVKVLSELESIDYIIVFGDGKGSEGDTPIPLLRAIQPDVLVKGGQYTREQVVGYDIVESYGGQVVRIDHIDGRSTTNIVERIRQNM